MVPVFHSMRYTIDYRVGGMGNTLVAHIMYSCGQWDLDLNNFFSPTGDAHAARKHYFNGIIIPIHMLEQPELIPANSRCILEIKTSIRFKLLELKMGYSKYVGKNPTIENVLDFFRIDRQSIDNEKLWTEFYNNIKDPLWPDCKSYADVAQLPSFIQDEIYSKYQPPIVGVNDKNWLSLLTIAYYDMFLNSLDLNSNFGGEVYLLDDYFDKNLDVVKKQVQTYLNWDWDDRKSNEFNHCAIKANHRYLNWLNYIQSLYEKTISGTTDQIELEAWEKALLLARICVYYNIDPRNLQWDNFSDLDTIEHLLDNLRTDHGKTI